jgi:hypothetical protein
MHDKFSVAGEAPQKCIHFIRTMNLMKKLTDSTIFDHIYDQETGFLGYVTGQQGVLTPLTPLISPLM